MLARLGMNLKQVLAVRKCLLVVLLLLVSFVGGVWAWLSAGPRDVSRINPYIESALQAGQSDIRVRIGSTILQWENPLRAATLQVHNIQLIGADDDVIQRIPELTLTLNLGQALLGHVVPHDIILSNPILTLVERRNGEWVWVSEDGKGILLMPLVATLLAADAPQASGLPFGRLSIEKAAITLYHEASDTTYTLAKTDAILQRTDHQHSELTYSTDLQIDQDVLHLAGHGQFDSLAQKGAVQLDLTEANPMHLCGMILTCADLPALDLPLSGSLIAQIAQDHSDTSGEPSPAIEALAFKLKGEFGSFSFAPHFPDAIPITSLTLQGSVSDHLRTLKLDTLTAEIGQKTPINIKAEITKVDDAFRIKFDGTAQNMPVNDLEKYWPATLAPESRLWATSAIRSGLATHAHATVNIEPEDFALPALPDDFLSADVTVKDTIVEYIKGFPKAHHINGTAHFTGTTMTATASQGQMLKATHIRDAKITFTDLNHPNVPIKMDVELDGPVTDVIAFLQPSRFDFVKPLPIDTSQAIGDAQGRIKLAFNSFSNETASDKVDWNKVQYDISAKLTGLGGILYDNRYALEQASGTFEADDNHLEASLDGLVNGSSMQLGYLEGTGQLPQYHLKGPVSEAMLIQQGLGDKLPVKGTIGVDAKIENTAAGKAITATLDLGQASLLLPKLGFQKTIGTPASLALSPAGSTDATRFSYQSSDLNVAGIAWIDRLSNSLSGVEIPSLKFGGQDLALRYHADPKGDIIDLKGPRADISTFMDHDKKSGHSISSMPPVRLTLDVDTLTLGENRVLRNAKGHLTCTPDRCESANLSAAFADKGSMKLVIDHQGGVRHFSLLSDNAGNMLRAFDAVDKMYDGAFDLTGAYDDHSTGNPLSGRLIIKDFRLKDAPVLGRILNLSSLTGLFESLGGQGISFDKLASDLVFARDIATIKNAKASGASLGISMDGTINLATSDIAVEGSFAPAHVLNSIISKIPIIGVALAGGEGESVFAFTYGVKGHYNDPSVSVNPLSVLTPGFTRKVFDIFDKPAPKDVPKKVEAPNIQKENSSKTP